MSITIVLTDAIRGYPYFSNFNEENVVIPDKPFIREILEGKFRPPGWQAVELLSIEDLQKCIETCIYFGLDGVQFIQELFWKITRTSKLFALYFSRLTQSDDGKSVEDLKPAISLYDVSPHIPDPLRSELVISWGTKLDRQKLIQLGARFLRPLCREIAASGNLRLLQWFIEKWKIFNSDNEESRFVWDKKCPPVAAAGGHLEILKYLHQNGCPWDSDTCRSAVEKGNLACLKYAHENGCPWDEWMYIEAIKGGTTAHFECFKYTHTAPGGACPWKQETCAYAASNGNLNCLQYAHENGCSWDKDTCIAAAGDGHLECLKYVHIASGGTCPWNADTCAAAAEGGHLECLRYAHENGCPWDEKTCEQAAQEGHLALLKYAHENGCPWGADTCSFAALGGYLICLQYAHENGCPWDEKTCNAAAGKAMECLQYAHENGCPWDEKTCNAAADGGQLECLKYARTISNGTCPWNTDTCLAAALRGNLECLKYANENGCPWNADTCSGAASGGHLACLEYAHQNGCPWDEKTCLNAARSGNLECLKYARENGCPWNKEKCMRAVEERGHLACLEYICENEHNTKRGSSNKKRRI